jgi:hypothetical protein
MTDEMLLPFAFPAVRGKKIAAAFDGGRITSDGGVMVLAEAERRLGIADKLAGVIADARDPVRLTHLLLDILRARILAIACGYEDADDLDRLRFGLHQMFADTDGCERTTAQRNESQERDDQAISILKRVSLAYLPAIKLMWAALAARADKEGWPAVRFLAALAEHEVADRGRRRIERHLASARLPAGKTFDTFDFNAVPKRKRGPGDER